MSPTPERKRCPRCDETKPAAEWNRSRASRDGLAGYCRPCACAAYREWRARNKARAAANGKAWAATNPERRRAISRRASAAYRARGRAMLEAERAAWLARKQEAAIAAHASP